MSRGEPLDERPCSIFLALRVLGSIAEHDNVGAVECCGLACRSGGQRCFAKLKLVPNSLFVVRATRHGAKCHASLAVTNISLVAISCRVVHEFLGEQVGEQM